MKRSDEKQASKVSQRQSGKDYPYSNDQANESLLNKAIIESINQALMVLDASFNMICCNRRLYEVFQVSPVNEKSLSLAEVLPDSQLDTIIRQSAIEGESLQEVEFSCRIGGQERQFLLSISGIDLPSSDRGTLITFDEITEWKRHQGQVMEASRLVSIGEMAAGIAHEVNNPLAAVMGFTQLAMRRNSDSRVALDLEKVLSESKRASKIITNLQSFARRYKPNKANVNIVPIIQNVLEFRSYELEVNNIEVNTSLEPDLPDVSGDEHQLEQVILNLVINAEFFMFNAHGGGKLNIEATRQGDKVKLSFSDDGPGIEPGHMSKIFDPFFTTKEVGQGTGLGLSICYGIVHEHDGVITVDSSIGTGSTFTIELPVSTSQESHSALNDIQGYVQDQRSLNILIVDDEPGVSEFVSRALSEYGHRVDASDSGSDVIERGGLEQYDLFILDVKMPGIGGAALYDHIDGVSKDLSSRVLFITGDTTNPATKEFTNQASSPLLTKPFTIENLVAMVNRVASKRRPVYLEDTK